MFCLIKHGIPRKESWLWPNNFENSLPSLICKLLQPHACNRLPMLPGGVENLRKHQWFKCIDWIEYETKAMKPPMRPRELKTRFLKRVTQPLWGEPQEDGEATWDAE